VPRAAVRALFLHAFAAGALAAQAVPDSTRAGPLLSVDPLRDSLGALQGLLVHPDNLMADGSFVGALRSGFPVRFAFRVGLWRDGRLLDTEERSAAWEAVVVLNPVSSRYELLRSGGTVETFADVDRLDAALAIPARVELAPAAARGRYYYLTVLEIESLSVSELQEVERWLRGDLGRALTERGDIGNALGRGARLALVRLSGLPHRRMEQRTPTLEAAPRP
jgi:hypothetical protein